MIEVSKAAANSPALSGLYSPSEAAFYARIHLKTMQHWLYGGASSDPVVFTPGQATERIVRFVDFVQALAIHNIRTLSKDNVSLQKIRQAVRRAKEEYGIEYPFAQKHTLFTVGGDICVVPEQNADGAPVRLTGKDIHNQEMRPIVEVYMKDLHFDAEGGLASRYTLFKYGSHEIEMDPNRRSGEPLIKSCGLTPYILWDSARTEGSIEETAKLYGVSEEEVEVAVRCYNYLEPRQKAA